MSEVGKDPNSDAVSEELVEGLAKVDLTSVVNAEFGGEVGIGKVLLSLEIMLRVELLGRKLGLNRLVVADVDTGTTKLEESTEREGTNVAVAFEPVADRACVEDKTSAGLELWVLDKIGVIEGADGGEIAARLVEDAANAADTAADASATLSSQA
jgi:hypothetical protein